LKEQIEGLEKHLKDQRSSGDELSKQAKEDYIKQVEKVKREHEI